VQDAVHSRMHNGAFSFFNMQANSKSLFLAFLQKHKFKKFQNYFTFKDLELLPIFCLTKSLEIIIFSSTQPGSLDKKGGRRFSSNMHLLLYKRFYLFQHSRLTNLAQLNVSAPDNKCSQARSNPFS
jgi:hypothetical protein